MASKELAEDAIHFAHKLRKRRIKRHNASIKDPLLREAVISVLVSQLDLKRKQKIANEASNALLGAVACGTLSNFNLKEAQSSNDTGSLTTQATDTHSNKGDTSGNSSTPCDAPTPPSIEEASFVAKVKAAWTKWTADGQWKAELKASGIRIAKATLVSAVISAAQYILLNGRILYDSAMELADRVGKFLVGLLYVTAWNSLKAGLLIGLIEIIARVARMFLSVTALNYLLPAIGPLITTIISIFCHVRAKVSGKLYGAQLAEWIILDIVQGTIYGLISLLPPGINMAVGIVVALTLGTFLSYLGAKQSELQNGASIRSLGYTWIKSHFVTVIPDEVDEVFCCPLSLQIMKEPAMLNGLYYEYKLIQQWVRDNGNDPVSREACRVADIKRCSEMSRFIDQYIHAYNC